MFWRQNSCSNHSKCHSTKLNLMGNNAYSNSSYYCYYHRLTVGNRKYRSNRAFCCDCAVGKVATYNINYWSKKANCIEFPVDWNFIKVPNRKHKATCLSDEKVAKRVVGNGYFLSFEYVLLEHAKTATYEGRCEWYHNRNKNWKLPRLINFFVRLAKHRRERDTPNWHQHTQ